MKLLAAAILLAAVASAQNAPANPLIEVSKRIFNVSKTDILASADKIPADMWTFQPTKEVRTIAQMFGHIADGQYEFCGAIVEGKGVNKGIEKARTTKAELVPALKEAFAYCDSAYAKLTDANAADLVDFFGSKITKLGVMDFNTAHNMEHYGNLVTYMRIQGIVPPSSEPPKPAAAAKK